MLVVSLRGVNCRFWCRLGFTVSQYFYPSLRVVLKEHLYEKTKHHQSLAQLKSHAVALTWWSVLAWSPLEVKLSLCHAQIGLL